MILFLLGNSRPELYEELAVVESGATKGRSLGARLAGGYRVVRDASIVFIGAVLGLGTLIGGTLFYAENHVTAPQVEFLFVWRWKPTISDLVLGIFVGGAIFGYFGPLAIRGLVRARERRAARRRAGATAPS
jgi:hypothetical protein